MRCSVWGVVTVAAALDAAGCWVRCSPCGAAPLRPPRLRRLWLSPPCGWSLRCIVGSLTGLTWSLFLDDPPRGSTSRSADEREGSAAGIGARVGSSSGGSLSGRPNGVRTGVPFASEHCPVVTESGGLSGEESPAPDARGGKPAPVTTKTTLTGLDCAGKCAGSRRHAWSLRRGPGTSPASCAARPRATSLRTARTPPLTCSRRSRMSARTGI